MPLILEAKIPHENLQKQHQPDHPPYTQNTFCSNSSMMLSDQALPDPALTYRSVSILSRWHLCQVLVRHLWQRWAADYLDSLKRSSKWHQPSANLQVNDVVVLREDNTIPAKWPLAGIVAVHKGDDDLVRVVTVKTSAGTYRRPVHKVVLLPTKPDKW